MLQETKHELNFVNYAFRHRTLKLLYEVKECQDKYDNSSKYVYDINHLNPEIIRMYKSKMQELFDEMRIIYMSTKDKFIKTLCDDIHISMKTFGTKYGNMCIGSRQTSQGKQRIYTVNTTPYDSDSDDNDIQRSGACYNSDSDSDDCQKAAPRQISCGPSCEISQIPLSLKLDDYEVSNDCMEDSPYLTQTAKTVMRSISYVSSSDSENENNDSNSDSDNDDGIPANNNSSDNSSDEE
jgi:hypothetical protein